MSTEKRKVNIKDATKYIDNKLYNFQKTTKALACAWNAGENVILYGPGGYGKSVGAEMFGNYLKEQGIIQTDPYILSFNQGITEEKIFGGMDVKKFQDTGEIIYLLEKAFVSYEYVIFEEMWDAYPGVLLSLKDTLTSGYVRNGNQITPIKTKMIVGCTNRERNDVITDMSTEALLQRFAFEYEVKWTSHNLSDYKKAFEYQGMLDDITSIVAEIVVDVNASKTLKMPVSPRTAVKAANAVVENEEDITCLEYFYGFNRSVDKFKAIIEQRKKDMIKAEEFVNFIKEVRDKINDINSAIDQNTDKSVINDKIVEFAVFSSNIPKQNDATAGVYKNVSTITTIICEKLTSNPFSKDKIILDKKIMDKIETSKTIDSLNGHLVKLIESIK